jgi:hypothetical protein
MYEESFDWVRAFENVVFEENVGAKPLDFQ